MTDEANSRRCGFVALIGRPNVGKSTLLNHLVGQKLSITSRKPQTTRQRLLGILTSGDTQIIFVDTPGTHRAEERAINRYMNRQAESALRDVDVAVLVVDGLRWSDDDELALERVRDSGAPVLLVINKVDALNDKSRLLPYIAEVSQRHDFDEIIPASALNGHNLDELERAIAVRLPVSPHFFGSDQVTDRSQRFLAAEIIREKIMRQLGAEVPYAVAVEIEAFASERGRFEISAVILVEKDGQKAIVIGRGGSRLKQIGEQARHDMERLFDAPVMLHLWVKVRRGWSDDERALKSLGYDES